LARQTLAGRPQRAADAEDAVQSALASFVQRARNGSLAEGMDRDDLWALLGVIAVRKARRQVRRENALKRGGGRVVDEGRLSGGDGELPGLDGIAGALPPVDFDLATDEMLRALGDVERTIALLRLFGYRNREIAERLDCTERKVERKLNLIRLTWKENAPP
jgi:DNA-directed RNA polymerase specialized sigma24 family protein